MHGYTGIMEYDVAATLSTCRNPIYSKDDIPRDPYDTTLNPAYNVINDHSLSCNNSSGNLPVSADYAPIDELSTSNKTDTLQGVYEPTGGNNSTYSHIGSATEAAGDNAGATATNTSNADGNPNDYDIVGNPFVFHYETSSNLSIDHNTVVLQDVSDKKNEII